MDPEIPPGTSKGSFQAQIGPRHSLTKLLKVLGGRWGGGGGRLRRREKLPSELRFLLVLRTNWEFPEYFLLFFHLWPLCPSEDPWHVTKAATILFSNVMHTNHPTPTPCTRRVKEKLSGEQKKGEGGPGQSLEGSVCVCVCVGAAVGCPGNDYHVSLIKSNLGWQEQLMSRSPSSCHQLLELLGRNDD